MGASVDDRKEENIIMKGIRTMYGEIPIRENSLLPPGTAMFVDPRTMKVLAVMTNIGEEDFTNCYEWFKPIRGA